MRILAMSDMHSSENAIQLLRERLQRDQPDLLVPAGDITNFGPPGYASAVLDIAEGVQVLAVHGNCDPAPVREVLTSREVSVHQEFRPVEKYTFVGLGGSPPPMMDIPQITDLIIISHVPPKGYNDRTARGHGGSSRLLGMVEKLHPILVVSGHIHEAQGAVKEGGTVFVNPGAAMDGHYAMIELEKGIKVELR